VTDFNAWPGSRKLWAPQPGPQTDFVRCPYFEVVYGGARGGGKTDAALGDFLHHALIHGADAKGLLVRRTRVALGPTLERAKAIFGPADARWEAGRDRFVFPDGAVLYLRPLDRDQDAEKYQGHDYSRVYVEELTQFASPRPVDKLKATLRSAAGVPIGFRATCNPGGPGHGWVKARYVDAGARVLLGENGLTRLFIPARVADNPALIANDPLYVERLRLAGSPALVRAWLEGDWSAVEGAFFDRWRGANVIAPFRIPQWWTRLRSFDWGYAAPFSVGWWAIVGDDTPVTSEAGPIVAPRGAMIRYREWYGAGGLRLEAEAVAQGIVQREAGEQMADAVADPSIFAQNGGPSIGERMARAGARFRPADNTRVGAAGAMSGWDQMRARIAGVGDGAGRGAGAGGAGAGGAGAGGAVGAGAGGETGTPMLYVFDTCRDFIRTVPGLGHDPRNAEDLDTNAEDHAADDTRYACLARPLTAARPVSAEVEDYWARLRRGEGAGWKAM
jgi:hypothetical protein